MHKIDQLYCPEIKAYFTEKKIIASCVFVYTNTNLPYFTGTNKLATRFFMGRKKKTKEGKNRQIHFRVTDEEFDMIRNKSKNYPSISLLLIHSVKEFDNRGGAMKIHSLNRWADEYILFRKEMSKIGVNLNQITEYLNILRLHDIFVSDDAINTAIEIIQEIRSLYRRIIASQEEYTRSVTKM